MIGGFLDYCSALFPSIDPYTKEGAKRALEQYKDSFQTDSLTLSTPSDVFLQGDIFTEMPFFYCDEDGEQSVLTLKAQLISNTCDATRDERVLFAGVFPLKEFESEGKGKLDAIKSNKTYKLFYIQGHEEEYVIDFSLINSVPLSIFYRLIQEKHLKRIISLSQIGYFIFITKLTVFLMRPEDENANSSRFPSTCGNLSNECFLSYTS